MARARSDAVESAPVSKAVGLPEPMRRGPVTAVLVIIGAMLLVVFALLAVVTGFDKTSGGEVGVVRNGGPLDNNRIRQVIQPASNLTWTGLWSQVHKYPSQQRQQRGSTSRSRLGRRPHLVAVARPGGFMPAVAAALVVGTVVSLANTPIT